MRDLNEVVNRNVKYYIDREISRADRDGYDLTMHTIAGRAAAAMGITQDAAYTQLKRNLDDGRNWTMNYVQGFASAVGKTPHDFIIARHLNDPGVSDATVAQCLYTALNHRMDTKTARSLIASLQRQLDFPPLFEFIQALSRSLLDVHSKVDAYNAVHGLIQKSDVFDSPRRDLRGKKKVDRKSE